MSFYGAILLAAFYGIVAVVAESCDSSLSDKVQDCAKQNGVSMDQLMEVLRDPNSARPTLANSCFSGCMLSALGAINASGMIVSKVLQDRLACNVSGTQFTTLSGLLNQCATMVNDEPVTDGTRGCDRSIMFVTCLGQDGSKLAKSLQGPNN